MLRAFGDDAVLHHLARRLQQPDEGDGDFLAKLVEQLEARAAGKLVEQLTPMRELDYAPHAIRLAVSSAKIGLRLRSVEKEPFTVEWIERSIRPGDVFYDIGANVGAYALIAAKATGNRARVFAFEPSASSFRDLSRNVLLNDCTESVVPIPLALWSESRPLPLGFTSLEAGAARHELGRTRRSLPTETILGISLDDLVDGFDLPAPTHAKIDVDGYELEVLRGAARTLRRPGWRSIIVELDRRDTDRNRAIRELLADAGFGDGLRHERLPAEQYPEVYWTFTRPG